MKSTIKSIFLVFTYLLIFLNSPHLFASPSSELIKKAELGDPAAQHQIALKYSVGEDNKETNMPLAIKWFTKAANQNYVESQVALGLLYTTGELQFRNPKEGLKWYSKAVELGSTFAQVQMGQMYYDGNGVSQDFDKAMSLYLKAAQHGDSEAQYRVAHMYSHGVGRKVDAEAAFQWYRKSMEQLHPHGSYMVGLSYATGEGVSRDFEESLKWLIIATFLQHPDAMNQVRTVEQFVSIDDRKAILESAKTWVRAKIQDGQ